jgi:hypothetical protein
MRMDDIQFLKVFGCSLWWDSAAATQDFPPSAYRPLIRYALERPLVQQST